MDSLKEVTVNVVKPGKECADEIKAMMDNFRACLPKEFGGSEVVFLRKDYKTLKATDANGNVTYWICQNLRVLQLPQLMVQDLLFVLQALN